MTTREQFHAVRRVYRALKNVPLTGKGAFEARSAAINAIRVLTGNLDWCEPAPLYRQQGLYRKHWVWSPTVTAACTRWLRAHR